MTKIVQKRLPNAISVADVTDATVRQKLMLAIQNIAVLMSQLSEAQKAIVELQRKVGGVPAGGEGVADVKTVVDATLQEKDIKDGADPNVQSDWSQTDDTADDFIKNKPEIPKPTSQVNSDWNATSGAAKILNKPTTMKNPYLLTLTPVDAAGAVGAVVQYDGSSAKSLKVLTDHQDISKKIDYPSGGSDNDVLMKYGTGVKWGKVATGNEVAVKSFSVTSGNMNLLSPASISVNVSWNGYTPLLVGNVACEGTNTGVNDANRACVCTSCILSGTSVSLTIRGTSQPVNVDQSANVSFTVLYKKN